MKLNSKVKPISSRKRVAIVYHYFAHYRKPILDQFRHSSKFEYHLLSDVQAKLKSIKTLDQAYYSKHWRGEDGQSRWQRLRNFWFGPLLWQFGIISNLLRGKYDSVIFLGDAFFLSTWLAAIVSRFQGTKVLYWSHGLYGRESTLRKLYRTTFYRLANAGILVYSNHARNLLVQSGFAAEKIYTVFNSLDHEQQLEFRARLDASTRTEVRTKLFAKSPNLPIAVFIGRLTVEKKLSLLVNLLEQNHANGNRFNLLFIGGGEYEAKLKESIPDKLSSYVHFFGPCYEEEEIAKMLNAADLCVSPGNIGLTAIHSLVYGTPVVTHGDAKWQGPEFEAIEPGSTGSFFDRGDLDSLSQAVNQWLFQNDLERDTTRVRCYQRIDGFFTPKNQLRIFEAALSGVSADTVAPSISDET